MNAHLDTQAHVHSVNIHAHHMRTEKRNIFIRDLVHNYCLVHQTLMEQAERFAHSGTISYAVLNELLGEPMRKGVFWLFKDIAHHLFRTKSRDNDGRAITQLEQHGKTYDAQTTLEHTLDWCIGYAFHECTKLREDAFQRQHYTNRLVQIRDLATHYSHLAESLHPLTQQTHESIKRELARILSVFEHMRTLLLHLLPLYEDNDHIARLIITKRALLSTSFHAQWEELLHALYGDKESTIFLRAARSFSQSGRYKKARALLEKAKHLGASAEDIEGVLAQTVEKQPA